MNKFFKSEFNDPVVQRHRRQASVRADRNAVEVANILANIVPELQAPVDSRVSALKERWSEIAGGPIAKHSQPGYIDKFTLHVWVDHPGFLPELQRAKRMILMKVQRAFPDWRIRAVRFALESNRK